MKIFKHYNQDGDDVCPVCKTNDDKPVLLAIKDGTEDPDGRIAEAAQIHVDCIQLHIMSSGDNKIIYQIFPNSIDVN